MKFALTFAILACAPALHAQTCTAQIEGGKRIESARHTLAYRTDPVKVVVGKPFAVDLAICPRESGARIEEVRVDGHMPEHRHGMNYKASIKEGPGGRYRAEGLMFHMPGRWELIFELRAAGRTDRLTQSEVIE